MNLSLYQCPAYFLDTLIYAFFFFSDNANTVMHLQAEDIKQSSVKVTWAPPVSPNGQVLAYMVAVFNAMEDTKLSMVCTFYEQVGNSLKYCTAHHNLFIAYFQSHMYKTTETSLRNSEDSCVFLLTSLLCIIALCVIL